ncbi:MAG: metallopeptidase family protein [Acidimicrobiales bacterium]
MRPIDEAAFERLVADALDSLPDEILDLLDNVVVLVEDEHPEEDLLGLYEGIPHTERDDYGGLALPDRITLYRLPLCEECDDLDDLREEVRITVVHELAHHLGIDDDRLEELGWG